MKDAILSCYVNVINTIFQGVIHSEQQSTEQYMQF